MIDVLLQIGGAKLFVSCMLAGLALGVQRSVGHPALIHRFWLLVLVALLLPAVVAIPVLPGEDAAAVVSVDGSALSSDAAAQVPANAIKGTRAQLGTPLPARITDETKAGLVITWLLGTALLLAWTLLRVLRFRHWLVRTSQPAPPELRDEVSGIGRRLGLARMPAVHTTTARVSPMVCWTGGRVRIVVPSFLLVRLEGHELRAMLAHELAHVRRRDHLVRWIEWLACSAFWWNPVAWWARREVRAAEEASCDALGAAAIECAPREYAESLLGVMENLSKPWALHAPVFASGVTSGRNSTSLERRLRMLVKGRAGTRAPRWARPAGLAVAASLLPLGLVYCGTADQAIPTPLEQSSMPPSRTTVIALQGTDRPDSTELEELWGDGPVYAYWIFGSSGHVGPSALIDAPVQPVECRLEPKALDEDARDEAMAACASAMSRDLGGTGVSDDRNVCVVWGSKATGWRVICEGWEPEEGHRRRAATAMGA